MSEKDKTLSTCCDAPTVIVRDDFFGSIPVCSACKNICLSHKGQERLDELKKEMEELGKYISPRNAILEAIEQWEPEDSSVLKRGEDDGVTVKETVDE